MPIICFEGASAVGKTSVADHLQKNFKAFVIPEVNLLFERPRNEGKFWYLEKQVERYQSAIEATANYEMVLLDGDLLQPLWYGWAYDFKIYEPIEFYARFFREKLANAELDFPHRYFILTGSRAELLQRKTKDAARTRKNYEKHLELIEPQKRYFAFLKSRNNDLVEFVENTTIEATSEKILNSIDDEFYDPRKNSSLTLFDQTIEWMKSNNAKDSKT